MGAVTFPQSYQVTNEKVASTLLCHYYIRAIRTLSSRAIEGIQPMPNTIDLRIAPNGRLVLPKALREAMGLSGDTKVIATLEGDELRLTPVRHRALRAQELYLRFAKGTRTVDDFLADRRAEAEADGDGPAGDPGSDGKRREAAG